jgi:membrane protein YqaA with SNARE-associated domain
MIVLFLYTFASNVALAVVPHEPVIIWYGAYAGVWITAAVATVGTLSASWMDHRVFAPVLMRGSTNRALAVGAVGAARRWFSRAPFATIAVSGVTPLPFWPFKLLAFAEGYPLTRYLIAVATGRFPRYVLLAWLGVTIPIPGWILATVFLLLLLPSLRMIPWQRLRAK